MNIAERVLEIEAEQCKLLSSIEFNNKISHIYKPLEYAHETHACYVRKYCNSPKLLLFLGMNPGPFGMAQNGVQIFYNKYSACTSALLDRFVQILIRFSSKI